MSNTLYWRPLNPPPPDHALDQLKYVISQSLWGHDGSLRGDPLPLDRSFIAYLRGIADAGSATVKEEAEELIDAIRQYGVVEVYLCG